MKVCGSCTHYQPNSENPRRAVHDPTEGVCRLNPPPHPNVVGAEDYCSHYVPLPKPKAKP